jgi:copper chaperone
MSRRTVSPDGDTPFLSTEPGQIASGLLAWIHCQALSRRQSCRTCAIGVHQALARVPGVVGVEVDLEAGRALVRDNALPGELLAAVEGAGYRSALAQDSATGDKPAAKG